MRTGSRTFVRMAIIASFAAASMTSDSGSNATAQERGYWVLVSNSADDTVSVIDFTTRLVTATFDVSSSGARRAGGASRPLGMAGDGNSAFVALQKANALAVISPENGVMQTNEAMSKPTNVAVEPVDDDDSAVMVVLQNPASIMLQTEAGPGGSTACDVKKPWALAYTPDSSTIGVAGKGGVDLIDQAAFPTRVAAATADVGGRQARDVAFAPDGSEGAFTDFKAHELVRFDPTTGAVISRTPMKKGPWGVRYNPVESGRMAVALNKKNKVACVTTLRMDMTVTKVGKGPTYLRYTPDGEHIVVVSNKANSVTVLSTVDCSVESVIAVGNRPWDLTILEQ